MILSKFPSLGSAHLGHVAAFSSTLILRVNAESGSIRTVVYAEAIAAALITASGLFKKTFGFLPVTIEKYLVKKIKALIVAKILYESEAPNGNLGREESQGPPAAHILTFGTLPAQIVHPALNPVANDVKTLSSIGNTS